MSTTHQQHPILSAATSPARRLVALLLRVAVVLLAALAASTLVPSSASAYQTVATNRPGGVTPYKVQGLHYNACAGLSYTCFNPDVFVPAPYVTRSPASTGTQTVVVMNTLYRWNGSAWAQYDQQYGTRTLPAGQSGGYLLSSEFKLRTAGYYQVKMLIRYSNSAGTVIGARLISYEDAGDYVCTGRFTSACNAASGHVYLRSPGL